MSLSYKRLMSLLILNEWEIHENTIVTDFSTYEDTEKLTVMVNLFGNVFISSSTIGEPDWIEVKHWWWEKRKIKEIANKIYFVLLNKKIMDVRKEILDEMQKAFEHVR